jgi:hypothetical protein
MTPRQGQKLRGGGNLLAHERAEHFINLEGGSDARSLRAARRAPRRCWSLTEKAPPVGENQRFGSALRSD